MNADGATVKAVCRYQQYRAVGRALQRLRTGKTRAQDGESDRRGGSDYFALLNDPLVRDFRTAPRMLDELLQAHAALLPQFA